MTNIEKLLNKEKERLDELQIPEDMESRLRNTLNNIPKKRTKGIRVRVAALIIVVLLLSYNMDTLAYYAKKIVGYENIMDGTLKELNELGEGQIIDGSYTFRNGVKVTLDGIMLDDNNMIAFYTIYDDNGDVDVIDKVSGIHIVGVSGKQYYGGGSGSINESGTEIKWIFKYDAPKFFEKSMKFKFSLDEEFGEIPFELDRNKAMGHSIKIAINKKIELDQRDIKIESLVASPTSTVIKGQVQNIVELVLDYISEERFRSDRISIALIADGVEIESMGSSSSSGNGGAKFQIDYDALPKDTKEIQLKLKSFGGYHDTKEVIELIKGETNNIKILDQDISIDKVYESEGNTYIKFTTEESLRLSRVYLNIDGEKTKLEETIPGDLEKIVEEYFDEANNKIRKTRIYNTRTMKFLGTGEELELDIQRIRFNKDYDKIIYKYSVE